MIVAIRTGVATEHWLEDPRALMTALDVLAEVDRQRKR